MQGVLRAIAKWVSAEGADHSFDPAAILWWRMRVERCRGVGHSMLPYTARGAVWLGLYLLFILAPLFALLGGSLPPTRDFSTEFSVAIDYSGLAMMGLQFGLTARFRYVTEPWGENVIYHFHRQISLIAVGLVIAHPLILFIVRPELLALLNSLQAPWRSRFAALSTYSLIGLVVMALWRQQLKIRN
jgi:predicted ferric reductase